MHGETFEIELADEAATARLGHALAGALPDSAVVALAGTLGAGKTRLVQALAEAAGVDRRDVVSPTFVLVQEYEGRIPIYHIDAYRLRDADEFRLLGGEEYLASRGWVLIEWAERIADCLPTELLTVALEVTGDQMRRARVTAVGEPYLAVLKSLRDCADSR